MARWKLPARIGYLTFNERQLFDPPGRLRLILRSGDRVEFTSTSSTPTSCTAITGVSLMVDTCVYPVDRIVHIRVDSKVDWEGCRAYAPLECAEQFSLFWLTSMELNLTPLPVRTRSMNVLASTTHRQQIMTRTQTGVWLGAASRRTRLRHHLRPSWSVFGL